MKRGRISIYLACLLFALVMATTYMTAGLYARYKTTASSSTSARVAKFEVSAGMNSLESTVTLNMGTGIVPSDSYSYSESFVVVNSSEVAVTCVILVENVTKNLPLQFTYDEGVVIGPGEKGTVKLYVKWPISDDAINYMGMVDLIKVKVSVNQVD